MSDFIRVELAEGEVQEALGRYTAKKLGLKGKLIVDPIEIEGDRIIVPIKAKQ